MITFVHSLISRTKIAIIVGSIVIVGISCIYFYSKITKLEKLYKQCQEQNTLYKQSLAGCQVQFDSCIAQMEKQKIEYTKRLKKYSAELIRLSNKISSRYAEIKPQPNVDTCTNLKNMLDEFVQVENQTNKQEK